MYCANCGSEVSEKSRFCEYCGTEMYSLGSKADSSYSKQAYSAKPPPSSTQYTSSVEIKVTQPKYDQYDYPVSRKSRTITLILWVFLGAIGAHYFYAGRIGMGILWLLTGGFFGIGLVIDIILILTGSFKDSFGKPIVNWDL